MEPLCLGGQEGGIRTGGATTITTTPSPPGVAPFDVPRAPVTLTANHMSDNTAARRLNPRITGCNLVSFAKNTGCLLFVATGGEEIIGRDPTRPDLTRPSGWGSFTSHVESSIHAAGVAD